MDLGTHVKLLREERQLSRRELAERSGLSYPYLSQIETGDRQPSPKSLQSLAGALGEPVEKLASFVSPDRRASLTTTPDERPPSTDLEAYRVSVLPSVERRLRAVPPLLRMELLAELMAQAAREANR